DIGHQGRIHAAITDHFGIGLPPRVFVRAEQEHLDEVGARTTSQEVRPPPIDVFARCHLHDERRIHTVPNERPHGSGNLRSALHDFDWMTAGRRPTLIGADEIDRTWAAERSVRNAAREWGAALLFDIEDAIAQHAGDELGRSTRVEKVLMSIREWRNDV